MFFFFFEKMFYRMTLLGLICSGYNNVVSIKQLIPKFKSNPPNHDVTFRGYRRSHKWCGFVSTLARTQREEYPKRNQIVYHRHQIGEGYVIGIGAGKWESPNMCCCTIFDNLTPLLPATWIVGQGQNVKCSRRRNASIPGMFGFV